MQKRKISLIELYGHSEVLYVLYKLLKDDFEVSVFTTEAIFTDAKDYFEEELSWYVQPKEESMELFLNRNLAKINGQELLIFVTLISSFRFFAKMNFQPKTIITIHNVNAMLASNKQLWLDKSSGPKFILDTLRFLRSWIRKDRILKQRLLQKMNFISFSSAPLSTYAKSLTHDFDDKIIESLPFSFYENHFLEKSREDEIIISIPGVVLQKLRDYEMVFQVLKKIIPTTQRKIKLQLLGKANSRFAKSLVKKMRDLEGDNFKLLAFEKPFSQKEFDQYLKQTDFMILPLKQYKKFGICREEYGVSTISGGLNDMIRFGIPTLLIHSYKIEKSFAPLISTFKTRDELKVKLEDWIENSTYLEIRKAGIPELENRNEENTRTNLVSQIENLLS